METMKIAFGLIAAVGLFFGGMLASGSGHDAAPSTGAALSPTAVEEFCRNADHVTAAPSGPEVVGTVRVASKGVTSIEWKDTGTNGVATYYYQAKDGQRDAPVEITQDAANCFRTLK